MTGPIDASNNVRGGREIQSAPVIVSTCSNFAAALQFRLFRTVLATASSTDAHLFAYKQRIRALHMSAYMHDSVHVAVTAPHAHHRQII